MERWTQDAACTEVDPELFFPVSALGPGAAQTQRAKEVCARCPVRAQCLGWALETRQRAGVWGGTDEKERATMLRRRATAGSAAS
ncbi:WhiB family transcriptional regulator [Streptomyces sp. NBC_00237]|uniref:WhiB family transcriptional regulator n=1 Tax=Streptomyces sp. NBC_00237 TaxID=2975687 RepID=UPI002253B119|nr:WhiB family transcriptional regulator [Streptomyces sp. NBC_00237]MCX5205544.1 WhiB family transcriptional regulator [Streptomyces sp. NBC_00237]